jgi:DNA-binding MarR family transcriptional regulator
MSEPPSSGATKDIGLSPADARELARLVGLLLRDQLTPEAQTILQTISAGTAGPLTGDRDRLAARASAIFAERHRRREFFPPTLFNEAGWDMLLAVYITDFAGGRQTVGKLISWIGAPHSTSIRWIDYLENHRLIARQENPDNRRIVFVDLTDKGRELLGRYLATLPDSIATFSPTLPSEWRTSKANDGKNCTD